MGPTEQAEIERKYDVQTKDALPQLHDVEGVAGAGEVRELHLEATYFDTPALDLARHRITLRRRTGGHDAGWHLKLARSGDERAEFHLPLGSEVSTVPAGLVDPVRGIVRDRVLAPVARVSTSRQEFPLTGEHEEVLALVCDDVVTAERLDGTGLVHVWREWEVELDHGHRRLLDTVEEALLRGGATPSASASKLARTLGDAVPEKAPAPSRLALAGGTSAGLLGAWLSEHTSRLLAEDAGVRTNSPSSVHRMRIAARRLRSALTTYRPVLEQGVADGIRDELKWLGQALSEARDAQVLKDKLVRQLALQRSDEVVGPVAARIEGELGTAYRRGCERALDALNSTRYFRLLDGLEDLVGATPVSPLGGGPAKRLVPQLLRRDGKRLSRAISVAKATEGGDARDTALHEARKKAKRLRYAAESAVPVFGPRAETLAKSVRKLQESLGEYQDSVVARERLIELSRIAMLAQESEFTYGRLHAIEEHAGLAAVPRFDKHVKSLPLRRLDRWVRQ